MDSNILPAEIVWIPEQDEFKELKKNIPLKRGNSKLPVCEGVQKLKQYIAKLCGTTLILGDIKQKTETCEQFLEQSKSEPHKENRVTFEERAFEIDCKFKFEREFSYESKAFVNRFCSDDDDNHPEVWLKFDIGLLSEDDSIKTVDYYLEIEYFSLGNIVGLNTFVEHFNSSSPISTGYKITQLKVKFLHDRKKFYVFFVVGYSRVPNKKRSPLTHRLYKLDVAYSSLNRILVTDRLDGFSLYFHVLQPPLLYAVIQNNEAESYISYQDIIPNTGWIRKVDLFDGCPSEYRKEFGMNTVLKLKFSKTNYDVLIPLISYCQHLDVGITSMQTIPHVKKAVIGSNILNHFDCYYALKCILTHSYSVYDQLTVKSDLLKSINLFLKEKCDENSPALTEALRHIYIALDKGYLISFSHNIKTLYEQLYNCISPKNKSSETANEGNSVRKQNILYIKKAFFMPTHIRFITPVPTLRNRALLHSDPNYSLRIAIRDINMKSLNFTISQGYPPERKVLEYEFFDNFIKNTLLEGVKIGKRTYKYVSSSTSQLRSHGLWFYARDGENKTADDLRDQTGDMTKITQVSKLMARMGQTFSQAIGRLNVPQDCTNVNCPEKDVEGGSKEYLELEDEKFSKNKLKYLSEKVTNSNSEDTVKEVEDEKPEPYVFSDGVGRISQEILDQIYEKLKREGSIREDSECPSAIQIRYAGCKGMLVLDPTIKGKKIFFRESMKKFDSTDTSLEILKISDKRTLYLNRPFITILEQLGVPKQVFLKLQREMIQGHIKSMFYEEDAMSFLHRNSFLRLDYPSLLEEGISFTEDPLFREMILAIFKKQVELLKTKARIEIPVDFGRTMHGVLDETFTLDYGEVFVQYTDWYTDVPKVVEGTVTVTKNPCMHPGDVRMFRAVHVKALLHIKDCIVFPAKGKRPHPDEMAGSDLDGDDYAVLWMKEFLFEENWPPMHFAVRKPKNSEVNKTQRPPITPEDEMIHLRQYILNDKVGLFAYAHLALADKLKDGIKDAKCIRLAKKYSLALDFIKSGISVDMDYRDVAHTYPDFMEKLEEKNTYLSTKANGCLFRNCKRLEIGLEGTKCSREFCLDEDLVYESWEKYESSALKSFKKYCMKIANYMSTYQFESEAEILAGVLNNVSSAHQDKHDFANIMALIEAEIKYIFKDFEREFFKEFNGKPKERGEYTDEMCKKASAWYVVTYTKTENDKYFFGLPWAVAEVLVHIKKLNSYDTSSHSCKSKSYIEKAIDENPKIQQQLEENLPNVTPQSDASIIHDHRFAIFDIASKILTKWLNCQKYQLFLPNFSAVKKCLFAELDSVTEKIVSCDVGYIEKLIEEGKAKLVLSPGVYVIQTLLQISKLGISTQTENSSMDEHNELGLFAWITLIKLACTANTQHLGIPDNAGEYAQSVFYKVKEDIVEVIQLPLFKEDIFKGSNDFSQEYINNEDRVIQYLINQTGLKNILLRTVEEKNNHFVLKITAQGSRFAIERLKDIVVLRIFYDYVSKNKPITFQGEGSLK